MIAYFRRFLMVTKGQREVYESGGVPGEIKAKKWLGKRGFRILKSYNYRHAGYWDIMAEKGREKWIIEVKSGEKPKVDINNLMKMLKTSCFKRIGLLFMPRGKIPLSFTLNKMSYAGLIASKTKGKETEKRAAKFACEARLKGKKG